MVWLAIVLGTLSGFAVGFMWSKAQAHALGSVVLRGDHRGVIVLGHAMLGAFAGALLFGLVAELWQRWRDRKARGPNV